MAELNNTAGGGGTFQVLQRSWLEWQTRRLQLQGEYQSEQIRAADAYRTELGAAYKRAQDSAAALLSTCMHRVQADPSSAADQQQQYLQALAKLDQELQEGAREANTKYEDTQTTLKRSFADRDLSAARQYVEELQKLANAIGREASATDLSLIAQGFSVGACYLRTG
jgi:tRNA(Met) C34 N-acetyltransferase TmcA